jgi:hypothetical protein
MGNTNAELRQGISQRNAKIKALEEQLQELQAQGVDAMYDGNGISSDGDHVTVAVKIEKAHLEYLEMYRRSSCYMRKINPESNEWTIEKEIALIIAKQYATDPNRALMHPGSATGPASSFNKAGGGW